MLYSILLGFVYISPTNLHQLSGIERYLDSWVMLTYPYLDLFLFGLKEYFYIRVGINLLNKKFMPINLRNDIINIPPTEIN